MWWRVSLSVVLVLALLAGTGFAVIMAAYPLRYRDYITESATEFDIEPNIIASLIRAESGFDKNAKSHRGAVGLMQLLPSTADWIAQKNGESAEFDLTDPETNIRLGTMYLRYLFDRFVDLRTVLIAYNAGEGNVAKWLSDPNFAIKKEDGSSILLTSPFPATNAYVDRILGARWIYRLRLRS